MLDSRIQERMALVTQSKHSDKVRSFKRYYDGEIFVWPEDVKSLYSQLLRSLVLNCLVSLNRDIDVSELRLKWRLNFLKQVIVELIFSPTF